MIAALHQPHYFPWIGYFDKMAKADVFVLEDELQFVKGSQMMRNRIIGPNGDIKFISITANHRGYCEKKYSEIPTVDNAAWTKKHLSMLREYYRKAPYYEQTLTLITPFFANDYPTLCQWTIASIELIRDMLRIPTKLVLQSNVNYDREQKKSAFVMAVCIGLGAEVYLSGRGASLAYLDRDAFADSGIQIVFQDFQHPVYPQIHTSEFVPGISILDMLFNCGIEETRRIFWENVKQSPDNAVLDEYRKQNKRPAGGVIYSFESLLLRRGADGVVPEEAA